MANLHEKPDPLSDSTVISSEGVLSEAEWAARDKKDSIYDGESMVSPSPSEDVIAAAAAHEKAGRDGEDADKAAEKIRSKQIVYDTADSIDSPGQSAGGTVIVRQGENSLEEAAIRRDLEKADAESERVNAALEASAQRKADEEAKAPAKK